MRISTLLFGAALALVPVGTAMADTARKGDVYPLDHCIVSGQALGSKGEPVVRVYEGREFRFCSDGCVQEFEVNKAKYIKKADEEIIARQKPRYPLATCVDMTDDKIDPKFDYVFNNRLIRICCKDCIKEIAAEPDKYLPVLDKAVVETQKPNYPLDACVVSGDKLDGGHGEVIEYVTGNRLVRFCCQDCIADFEKDPTRYLKKLDDAEKNRPTPK